MKKSNVANNQTTKQRIFYIVAVAVTIILGLASRKFSNLLNIFIAENAGDALWAMMVYFGLRSLLVQQTRFTAFILSILFSFSIEFSQLYQAEWINQIRDTRLGALILGKGFLAADLLRYLIGIVIAAGLDRILFFHSKRS